MVKRYFSSGLSRLDQFVGKFLPGDSFLTFFSEYRFWSQIVNSTINYAIRNNIPVTYLSCTDLFASSLEGHRKTYRLQFDEKHSNPKRILNAINKNLPLVAKRSYILIDELSTWKNFFGSEKQILELFGLLTNFTVKQNAFLLCSARRSAFKRESLAYLKDTAKVCIDISSYNDDTYCIPLSTKGRYAYNGILPLRMKISELAKPGTQTLHEYDQQLAKQSKQFLGTVRAFDEKYYQLFQGAGEAMVLFNLKGDYREYNRQAVKLFDIFLDDLHLKKATDVFIKSDKWKVLRFITELRSKHNHSGLFTLQRKKRGNSSVEVRCSEIGNDFFLAVVRDVSVQQQKEQILAQGEQTYKSLLHNAGIGVLVVVNNKLVFTNEKLLKLIGYSTFEELDVKKIKDILTPSSYKIYQGIVGDLQDITSITHEVQLLKNDGSAIECNATLSSSHFAGKKCVQITFYDISQQKRLTEALAHSEKNYRTMIEQSINAVAVVEEKQYVFANKVYLELFGFGSSEELYGREIACVIQEAERDQFNGLIEKHAKKKTDNIVFEGIAVRKDASTFNIEIIVGQGPSDKRTLVYCRDISSNKKIETELNKHVNELSILDEIYKPLSSSMDLDALVSHTTHKIMDIMHCELGACYIVIGSQSELKLQYHRSLPAVMLSKMSLLPLDEGFGGFLSKTQEPHAFTQKTYPSYLPFRSIFESSNIQSMCFLPFVDHGKLIGFIMLCSKRDEALSQYSSEFLKIVSSQIGSLICNAISFNNLKEIEHKYHTLIESLFDIAYSSQPSGQIQYIAGSVERLTGYTPKEFYRNPSLWLKLVHPDDKRILLERTIRLNEQQENFVSEYRIIPKGKATPRWVRDSLRCIKDEQGSIIALMGSITDITDTREIIDELEQKNKLNFSVLSSIQEGVVVYDQHLKCLLWNQSMERFTGSLSKDIIGKSAISVMSGIEPDGIKKLLGEALAGKVVTSQDHLYYNPKSRKERYVWGRYSPLRNNEGEIVGVVGIITDISDRKKLEGEMRESEQVLRNVIDTMGDVLIITDLKGNVLEVNQSFLRTLGYSRSDVIGMEFPYPWLLDEEMGRFVLWIAELRDKNWLHDFDMTWRAKDKHHIPMSVSTTLLRNSMGEPIAMLNLARDITERTRLTKDLESRNTQIEMINRIVNKANQTMDFDEIFHAIAEEIASVVECDSISVGLLEEDSSSISIYVLRGTQPLQKGESIPLKQTVSQYAFEAKKPIIINDLTSDKKYRSLRSFHYGLKSQISLPIFLKDKPFGTLNIASNESNVYTEEHTHLLQPLSQQIGTIVDRVQLFRRVTDDAAYIHNLLDSIDSIVYTVDRQYRIREVNKAWHEFMQESGFPGIRNYQDVNLFDVLPSEALKNMIHNVIDHLLDGSVRIFSEEYSYSTRLGERVYQITINPMIIEHRITGLVFTHTDITTLKKAEAELKKSYEQMLALNEISTLINASLDLDEILQSVIPLLQRDIGADAILVYLIDQTDKDLVLAKQIGFEGIDNQSISRLKQSGSATGSVVSTKEPLYINEAVFLDERIVPQNREILKKANIQAMAVIPLTSKDRVLGALDVFYNSEHEFHGQERQILSLVGNQLGSAIENAQLYGELRSQIDRLTVLYELSQQLTSTLDIDQIFQAVERSIQHVVSFDTFSIDLYDSTLMSLKTVYQVSVHDEQYQVLSDHGRMRTITSQSPEEHVVSTKHSLHDTKNSGMYVPMLSKETIIGIMSVQSSDKKQYSETHLQLLESVANLAAIALDKAKLYEETVKISLEIQRRNKELDDFTYVVSHDLKEPLISIEGYSRILQLDYHQTIHGEGKEYLDSIVGATTRMKGLIDDLLMLSRVSRTSEMVKPVVIANIINDIKFDMEFTIKQKGVNFIIPSELPIIYGNETQLKVVFRNLIGNAIKFNKNVNPMVEVGFQNAENNSYLFFIRDNGIGISKEFYEKIFVIFQRLHRREEYEGSGAGLAIVKKIIEMHKGKIWVESEKDKGSTFFFIIPRIDIQGG